MYYSRELQIISSSRTTNMVNLLIQCLVACTVVIGLCSRSQPEEYDAVRSRTSRDFKQKFRYSKKGDCTTKKPSSPYIIIAGTEDVSDEAVDKACTIVSLMTKYMSNDVFKYAAKGKGVAVFSADQGLVAFPENNHKIDTPWCKRRCDNECYITCQSATGPKWKYVEGLNFDNRTYTVAENVLCSSSDPYGGTVNSLVYYFATQLQMLLPIKYQKKIRDVFLESVYTPIWGKWCFGEESAITHWGVATEAFFMTSTLNGTKSPVCGMNECNFEGLCEDEAAARAWLKVRDEKLFTVLSEIYTNGNGTQLSGLKTCI